MPMQLRTGILSSSRSAQFVEIKYFVRFLSAFEPQRARFWPIEADPERTVGLGLTLERAINYSEKIGGAGRNRTDA